jgi:hypothetical protein
MSKVLWTTLYSRLIFLNIRDWIWIRILDRSAIKQEDPDPGSRIRDKNKRIRIRDHGSVIKIKGSNVGSRIRNKDYEM